MNTDKLISNYYEIESKSIAPLKEILNDWENNDLLKEMYKGLITIQSPLVNKPDILFVGVNPGEGAYREIGKIPPVKLYNKHNENKLDWYKNGNARCKKRNGKWIQGFEWYERDKTENNPFVARMIDVLYAYAEKRHPDIPVSKNEKPEWHDLLENKIMYTNLYPIATSNIAELKKIHGMLAQKKDLQEYWMEVKSNDKTINEWTVRKYFIRQFKELIELTQPKIVVCIGLSAFEDLTYSSNKATWVVPNQIKLFNYNTEVPILGFSRKGNWSTLTKTIGEKIEELINK